MTNDSEKPIAETAYPSRVRVLLGMPGLGSVQWRFTSSAPWAFQRETTNTFTSFPFFEDGGRSEHDEPSGEDQQAPPSNASQSIPGRVSTVQALPDQEYVARRAPEPNLGRSITDQKTIEVERRQELVFAHVAKSELSSGTQTAFMEEQAPASPAADSPYRETRTRPDAVTPGEKNRAERASKATPHGNLSPGLPGPGPNIRDKGVTEQSIANLLAGQAFPDLFEGLSAPTGRITTPRTGQAGDKPIPNEDPHPRVRETKLNVPGISHEIRRFDLDQGNDFDLDNPSPISEDQPHSRDQGLSSKTGASTDAKPSPTPARNVSLGGNGVKPSLSGGHRLSPGQPSLIVKNAPDHSNMIPNRQTAPSEEPTPCADRSGLRSEPQARHDRNGTSIPDDDAPTQLKPLTDFGSTFLKPSKPGDTSREPQNERHWEQHDVNGPKEIKRESAQSATIHRFTQKSSAGRDSRHGEIDLKKLDAQFEPGAKQDPKQGQALARPPKTTESSVTGEAFSAPRDNQTRQGDPGEKPRTRPSVPSINDPSTKKTAVKTYPLYSDIASAKADPRPHGTPNASPASLVRPQARAAPAQEKVRALKREVERLTGEVSELQSRSEQKERREISHPSVVVVKRVAKPEGAAAFWERSGLSRFGQDILR